MSFFKDLFNKDGDDKKKSGAAAGGGGPKNPFQNFQLPGQKKFQGSGQSLGGTAPGKLIHVELKDSGTLGLKVSLARYKKTCSFV